MAPFPPTRRTGRTDLSDEASMSASREDSQQQTKGIFAQHHFWRAQLGCMHRPSQLRTFFTRRLPLPLASQDDVPKEVTYIWDTLSFEKAPAASVCLVSWFLARGKEDVPAYPPKRVSRHHAWLALVPCLSVSPYLVCCTLALWWLIHACWLPAVITSRAFCRHSS